MKSTLSRIGATVAAFVAAVAIMPLLPVIIAIAMWKSTGKEDEE